MPLIRGIGSWEVRPAKGVMGAGGELDRKFIDAL